MNLVYNTGMDFITKDGLVALQHRTSNPATVRMDEDGTTYSWVPQHNISIAFVQPKHVDALLKVQARMCCGKTGQKFFPASQINVNIWQTGNRHGSNS